MHQKVQGLLARQRGSRRTDGGSKFQAALLAGRDQTGPWKIDARYNADELIFRIQSIAEMRRKIKLTRSDALNLLRSGLPKWPKKTLHG